MSIDELVFGNPSSRDHEIMKVDNFLDKLIPGLKMFSPPRNSSAVTISELNVLADLLKKNRDKNHNAYDEDLLQLIKQVFTDAGAEKEFIDTVATGVAEDVIPLVTKLKYMFNRPRPQQLSWYYDMSFFPDHSYFTNNPSYPSGHVTLTVVTCNVLGNHFPESYSKVQNIITNVRDSRLHLGVHYPSDNDTAMVVAKAVLNNPEFKQKYRL